MIIPGLDLAVAGGQVTSIIGPNGCGKSTLLRAGAAAAQRGGHIELYGQALHALPSREIARRLAILPQGPTAPRG